MESVSPKCIIICYFIIRMTKKKKRQIRINCVKAVVNGCTDCIMKYKH